MDERNSWLAMVATVAFAVDKPRTLNGMVRVDEIGVLIPWRSDRFCQRGLDYKQWSSGLLLAALLQFNTLQ